MLVKVIKCYPTGAPEAVCEGLVPKHGVAPQTSKSPYVLTAHQTNGSMIELIIESHQNTPFRGFAIQAHNVNQSNEVIGQFSVQEQDRQHIHTIHCSGGRNNTITHSDKDVKQSVSVQWKAPSDLTKGTAIKFVGTVVKD
ncbi:unnamed protein product, partial [Oppiella nova]